MLTLYVSIIQFCKFKNDEEFFGYSEPASFKDATICIQVPVHMVRDSDIYVGKRRFFCNP